MKKKFVNYISENELIAPNDKILLAISGGIDSMVMFSLFSHCGYDFSVAHCNFSLRGDESDADEQFVRVACEKNNRRVFVKRFQTEDYAKSQKISIQEAARNLRYAWFDQLCDEQGFNVVAIAHNVNDVAETILLNLTRGTGLKGLTGIKVKSKKVIRPMLFASRFDIEKFAAANSIIYRDDSSNTSVKYARNRIRYAVIPELEEINSGAVGNIMKASQLLGQVWQSIDFMNNAFAEKAKSTKGNEVHYSIEKLTEYPFRAVFLVEELSEFGFSASDASDVEKSLFAQPGKTFIAKDYQLIRDRDLLIVSPINHTHSEIVIINSDIIEVDKPIALKISKYIKDDYAIRKLPTVGVFDLDKLTFPLTLRPWRKGDWFIPLGMKGKKKVSDLLIDLKIPLHQKETVFVLESDGKIVWVVGFRIDDRFKVTSSTQQIIEICQVL